MYEISHDGSSNINLSFPAFETVQLATIKASEFFGGNTLFQVHFKMRPSKSTKIGLLVSLSLCKQFAIFIVMMVKLTPFQRARAHGMIEAGQSVTDVARYFGVSENTIRRNEVRYRQTDSFKDRPRSGRPRVTSGRQDRHIRLSHLRDRFLPAARTAATTIGTHGRPISGNTTRRRLVEAGLSCRRPLKGPILTPRLRQRRLDWCQPRVRWTRMRWSTVLFTDESRFCVSFADGRLRIWRRKGERTAANCVLQFNRWGGASVMVWGGISLNHRTDLVVIDGNMTAQRYIDQVLRPHVVPFFEDHADLRILQQDNARPHAARLTREFLDDQEINVMGWPAYSPDLNPIEHMWDILGRKVAQRNPSTRPELIRFLQEEWIAIPQQQVRSLVGSMRRRCTECLDAMGGHTHY